MAFSYGPRDGPAPRARTSRDKARRPFTARVRLCLFDGPGDALGKAEQETPKRTAPELKGQPCPPTLPQLTAGLRTGNLSRACLLPACHKQDSAGGPRAHVPAASRTGTEPPPRTWRSTEQSRWSERPAALTADQVPGVEVFAEFAFPCLRLGANPPPSSVSVAAADVEGHSSVFSSESTPGGRTRLGWSSSWNAALTMSIATV